MPTKSICILANSFKFSDRCIAGIEVENQGHDTWLLTNRWVRPLSHRQGGAINFWESYLDDRSQPELLDIVDVPLADRVHVRGQPEDWLIQEGIPWRCRGTFDKEVLESLLEEPKDLWLESFDHRDRVSTPYLQEDELPSLYLVRVERFEIVIEQFLDEQGQPKKKRRGRFVYRGVQYNLALTDPEIQQQYFPAFPFVSVGPIRPGPSGNSILCLSLTPEFHGYHYKIVATVIE